MIRDFMVSSLVVWLLMRVEVSVWKLLLDEIIFIMAWEIITDGGSMAWKAVMWQLLMDELLIHS